MKPSDSGGTFKSSVVVIVTLLLTCSAYELLKPTRMFSISGNRLVAFRVVGEGIELQSQSLLLVEPATECQVVSPLFFTSELSSSVGIYDDLMFISHGVRDPNSSVQPITAELSVYRIADIPVTTSASKRKRKAARGNSMRLGDQLAKNGSGNFFERRMDRVSLPVHVREIGKQVSLSVRLDPCDEMIAYAGVHRKLNSLKVFVCPATVRKCWIIIGFETYIELWSCDFEDDVHTLVAGRPDMKRGMITWCQMSRVWRGELDLANIEKVVPYSGGVIIISSENRARRICEDVKEIPSPKPFGFSGAWFLCTSKDRSFILGAMNGIWMRRRLDETCDGSSFNFDSNIDVDLSQLDKVVSIWRRVEPQPLSVP